MWAAITLTRISTLNKTGNHVIVYTTFVYKLQKNLLP